MQKSFLELSQTGIHSSLAMDYLNDEKSLREFYSLRPEISSFEKAIQEKKKENPGLGRRPGSGTTDTVQYRDKAPARESENRGRSKSSDRAHSS